MNDSPIQRASRLFAANDGLADVRALIALGVTRGVIRQRLRTGEWESIGSAAVGLAGTPITWHRQVRAATLAAGVDAAVSGPTAARLHKIDGFADEDEMHLTSFSHAHRSALPGITVHRARGLTRRDCTSVDGLVVVSRALTLAQIARIRGRDSAGQALDDLLRRGDLPLWIRQVALAHRGKGVVGPVMVLDLLNERVDARLPRSWFQRIAARVLGDHGIETVDEHPVHDASGALLAELDLAIPHLRVGIECQSWAWHATRTARAADARRRRRLRVLGWELVEVWWSDLERIDEVLEELRYVIGRRAQ